MARTAKSPAKKPVKARGEKAEEKYLPRLLQKYRDKVTPLLVQRFGYKNPMEVPRIVKVSINMGIGDASRDAKAQEEALYILRTITGQQPMLRRAHKSIAGFKVRKGMVVGCSVTLRRWRMWEFLDRFINLALPRVRDFRGLSRDGFDGRGNYTRGIRDQAIFPEIEYQKITRQRGMNITIATTARTDEESLELLRALGFPFRES